MRVWIHVVMAVVAGLLSVGPAGAQTEEVEQLRRTINQGTVGIVSGGVNGTYIQIANDLSKVLDDPHSLRVLPVIGKGSVQNITDVLYLRGIDIGIVQSDVLAFIKRNRTHPTIERRIRYITKLYNEEFHLLGGPGVSTVEDLKGKKVNFGVEGSGTYMTTETIFDTLGIDVEPVSYDQALAYEKLRTGEIAAMAYVAGKPTKLFTGLEPEAGIAFIPIPATPELLETYLPAKLENADYPRLIDENDPVDTVAVGAVMAVYNWDPNGERYRKVANFVEAFFNNFDEFLEAPRHPKWQEVNLSAVVPGWTRFAAAQKWLDAQPPPLTPEELATKEQFEAFVLFLNQQRGGPALDTMSPDKRRELFRDFLDWQQARGN